MMVSLIVVLGLIVLAYVIELAGLHVLLGVVVPYAAVAVFVVGFLYRIVEWARVPVPFRIPTTSGQQESLPWIKQNKLDNPSTIRPERWAFSAGCFSRCSFSGRFLRTRRPTSWKVPD
jgi:nitrate reductase gamma subunit